LGRRRIVCVNYLLSDERLTLDQDDLFTANQIIHLRPLLGADLYGRFVDANPFVARFYPNSAASQNELGGFAPGRLLRFLKTALEQVGRIGLAGALEALCRTAYGNYLRRQSRHWRSPDQVRLQSDCLKLHTRSHRTEILTRYEESIERAFAY